MRIIDRSTTPPGRWRYVDPATGEQFGPTPVLEKLLREIRQFLEGNGREFSTEEVETTICEQLGIENSHCGQPPRVGPVEPQKFGVQDVLRFLHTVSEWMWKTRFAFVPEEEALARAEICRNCPKKADVSGCGGCQGVLRWLKELIPNSRKHIGADLPYCGICHCSLPLKIHLPDNVGQASSPSNAEYPQNCWFRK